jgi:hypothetical protein
VHDQGALTGWFAGGHLWFSLKGKGPPGRFFVDLALYPFYRIVKNHLHCDANLLACEMKCLRGIFEAGLDDFGLARSPAAALGMKSL